MRGMSKQPSTRPPAQAHLKPPAQPECQQDAPPVTHYENFPVASLLCPPALRAPIAALYHFARTADDLADEGDASPEQRLADLAVYAHDLQSGLPSARWESVFAPLRGVIKTHALPLSLLLDLLDAFAQDVRKTAAAQGYATQDELLDYCRRSANPVGRLLLHLYGVADEDSLHRSDDICTALQLINFWQDLSVDIPRGRHYLSDQACAVHCALRQDIQSLRLTPAVQQLLQAQAKEARARMLRGAPLAKRIPGRAGWELRLVVQGGLRILDKIDALQGRNLTQRPRIRVWDAPLMLLRAALM